MEKCIQRNYTTMEYASEQIKNDYEFIKNLIVNFKVNSKIIQ